MLKVIHNDGDVARMRNEENVKAEIVDQNAKIDYLAMMSDIEFPEDESAVTGGGENDEEV